MLQLFQEVLGCLRTHAGCTGCVGGLTARVRRGNSTQRTTAVSSGRGNDDWREEQAGDHRAAAVGSAWCSCSAVCDVGPV